MWSITSVNKQYVSDMIYVSNMIEEIKWTKYCFPKYSILGKDSSAFVF